MLCRGRGMSRVGAKRMPSDETLEQLRWWAEHWRGRHDARRHYENRYLFAILVFLALGMAATIRGEIHPGGWQLWASTIAVIVIVGITVVYLAWLHQANRQDKERAWNAEAAIKAILSDAGIDLGKEDESAERWWKSWLFQSLTVIALMSWAILVVWGWAEATSEKSEDRRQQYIGLHWGSSVERE